jgi:cobalt/nickel transport system permease protein
MHIPDGMLSTPTWTASWLGAAGFLGYAVREVRRRFTDSRLVLMAVLAALIFALQMLNFPVAGGTSGHFAGGAAAAILLGPWPAVLIMATVLIIQSLVFADGGVTALGANILNMAVIGPFAGWWAYSLVARARSSKTARVAGSFVGAWLAVVLSAAGAALMVWLSGAAPFGVVVGAMAFWHAIIGLGEGAITAGLVGFLTATRPDLVSGAEKPARPLAATMGLATFAVVAAGISFLASSSPDGLEHVAERLGFASESAPVFGSSPIPDYVVPGLANETLAGILAGLVGLVLTGAVLYGTLVAIRGRQQA